MTFGVVTASEFDRLLCEGTALIDVRAEIEFDHGAIPGAVNLPILDTNEREQVGTCYKREGQQAAVALGHRLVSGHTRAQRTARWCDFLRMHPDAVLHCWRGGMRSRLAAEWISVEGVPVRVVEGGYKALRLHLLHELEVLAPQAALVVIGGRTGSAKTVLIRELAGGIDLEGFAHHRGSSFGRRVSVPPSQAGFENALAVALLHQRLDAAGATLFLEDESRQIGPVTVPQDLHRTMKAAPLVIVESRFEERVDRILTEYIHEDLSDWLAADPEHGFVRFGRALHDGLTRIARRLGGDRHRTAEGLLHAALERHRQEGDTHAHRAWIALLLHEYYDPMYEYQLGKAADRVVFRGDFEAVRAWCCETRLASKTRAWKARQGPTIYSDR